MMDMWRIIEQSSHGENVVRVVPIEYTSIAAEVYRCFLGFKSASSGFSHPGNATRKEYTLLLSMIYVDIIM